MGKTMAVAGLFRLVCARVTAFGENMASSRTTPARLRHHRQAGLATGRHTLKDGPGLALGLGLAVPAGDGLPLPLGLGLGVGDWLEPGPAGVHFGR